MVAGENQFRASAENKIFLSENRKKNFILRTIETFYLGNTKHGGGTEAGTLVVGPLEYTSFCPGLAERDSRLHK